MDLVSIKDREEVGQEVVGQALLNVCRIEDREEVG